ncbi:aminoglycoside N(3)-acetyltransferase [Phytohabitans rumicis]|uniref:Aminoglycoside N(3)-acetyltransferase n=1 Tax=Phytohabitans rumicis TaxID=1076125 RepID=A0A6V8L5X5_9ACTN|nr:AAC(3) family N-acetyltransferase [Phytohabitans rumicis]GFJ92653.1 AAC(3) family N-acetyltransferase [Phytohabitans rumicis]
MTTIERAAGTSRTKLAADLVALGLRPGRDVLVHCSMRGVGGEPAALAGAITDVIGRAATLVVPTHTTGASTTSPSFREAAKHLTPPEVEAMERMLPQFSPSATTHGMGALAEHVRNHPEAVRSSHPLTSFTALGPGARDLVAVHDLACHLGERSPLGPLYAADASILLLGVGYAACTALHLAEYRLSPPPALRTYRCYVEEGGARTRKEFRAPELDDSDFEQLGADLDDTSYVRRGQVGNASSRLIDMRGAVDFAVEWLTARRKP